MRTRYDLVTICLDTEQKKRFGDICSEFNYEWQDFDSLESVCSIDGANPFFVAISCLREKERPGSIVQFVKQLFPSAFILVILTDRINQEEAFFSKKSGADAILMASEVFQTSKLEYIISQIVRASYIPIKTTEIFSNTTLLFDLFHLLPQHGKFLHCGWEGSILSKKKFEKLQTVGELYIKRKDVDKFKKYSDDNNDMSIPGVARRCRAQYISLYSSFNDMVLLFVDQSNYASFKEGYSLYDRCKVLCSNLLSPLSTLGDPHEVINNSNLGDFGSVERATAVASYVGIFALNLGRKDVEDLMLSSMLSDIGIIMLPPSITKKIREGKISSLTVDEMEQYENHPIKSLNLILDRKLPLPSHIRDIILLSHEHEDGSGFPKRRYGKIIPEGSQLIQLSERIDQKSLLKLGQERKDSKEIVLDVIREADISGKYKSELLKKILS